jgi:hypothetical protein
MHASLFFDNRKSKIGGGGGARGAAPCHFRPIFS